MKAFVFPGQASQFPGMGKNIYDQYSNSHAYFEKANDILGFNLTELMFLGTASDLKETAVTQPAVFLYSYLAFLMNENKPTPGTMAGHSLGEITALVASRVLSYEEGLGLVKHRAEAMQKACEVEDSTMAAVLGLSENEVRKVCANIDEDVVPANYNCPGQIVISGSRKGIDQAIQELKNTGAKRALPIAVGGAFHSKFMKPAEDQLMDSINDISFSKPICPIYQNVDAKPHTDPKQIKENLILQLTSPVLWTQTMENMITDGVDEFIECGGKVLSGFVKRVDRRFPTRQLL